MKKLKMLLVLALSTTLLVGLNSTQATFAATGEDELISLQSTNYAAGIARLTISKTGLATCSATAIGYGDTTYIKMVVHLQRYNSSKKKWETEVTWTKTDNEQYLISSGSYQLYRKGKYRLHVKNEVTRNGYTEKITTNSSTETW